MFNRFILLGLMFCFIPAKAAQVKVSEELTLYYEESGHGDVVVLFIPGYTMTTEVFSRQLDYFKDSTEYRFITYDPRGQGRSSKTEGGHFYEQHGKDLNNFISALELDQLILGGWSYGGLDALSYINQYGSEKLKGLVLIDSPPKSTGNDNTKEWVWYNHDDSDGYLEFFTMAPLRDRESFNIEFAKWMLEDASEANIAWVASISNSTTGTVAALLNAAGSFLNYEEDLKQMNAKTPLLYVVQESYYDVAKSWTNENTPNAEAVGFGKHLMFWEQADKFNEILNVFLNRATGE